MKKKLLGDYYIIFIHVNGSNDTIQLNYEKKKTKECNRHTVH